MSYFIFNGTSSGEFGIKIESKEVFSSPKYDNDFTGVPGRNGDLITSNNRFENIEVEYTCFLARKSISELADVLRRIKAWLYSSPHSYKTLTDSYQPDFTRYGVVTGALSIEEQLNKVGSFTIKFNCKPFMYLTEGFDSVSYSDSGFTITNPYLFNAKPYIKVTGDGDVTMTIQSSGDNSTWYFSSIDEYLEIDSELMNFYKDTILKNSYVTGSGFPVLYPGDNIFSFEGDISEVVIIPRWCTL